LYIYKLKVLSSIDVDMFDDMRWCSMAETWDGFTSSLLRGFSYKVNLEILLTVT
jgi:hypothetical protein